MKMPRVEYARQIMEYAQANWDDLEALRPLVVQMLQGAFFDEAVKLTQRACELSNENVNDLYWRAVSKSELGLLDEAAQEFAQLREDAAYPADQARAAVGEARVYARKGDVDRASSLLESAVETDPDATGPYMALYAFWHEQNQPETGLAKLNQMAHRYPEKSAPYRALAQTAMRSKDKESLLKYAETALQKATPDDRVEILAEMTWLFGEGGMPEQVIKMIEPMHGQLIHPQALLNLAQAYAETGQKEKARQVLEQAKRQMPPELRPMLEQKLRQLNES